MLWSTHLNNFLVISEREEEYSIDGERILLLAECDSKSHLSSNGSRSEEVEREEIKGTGKLRFTWNMAINIVTVGSMQELTVF